jgi:integration host factor subunit alpha
MSGSVTRFELCNAVRQKVGLSRAESTALVELVLKEITDCLERGETVMLTSFGSFEVRKKRVRIGRHPVTGEKILITPRRVIVQAVANPQATTCVKGIEPRSIKESPVEKAKPRQDTHRGFFHTATSEGGHAGGAAL